MGRQIHPSASSATVVLAALVATAYADIPGHAPSLDANCDPGFQWSRKIAACGQAHCPRGASRTHVLACSCGEAWGKPFQTCITGGLATHCVPEGAPCGADTTGFDPMTGGCRDGFLPAANGGCERTFPARLRCRVEDVDGKPLAGVPVSLGERAGSRLGEPFSRTARGKTDDDGRFELDVVDRRSHTIAVRATPGAGRFAARSLQRASFDGTCTIVHVTAADAERKVEDAYADLLTRACVDARAVARLRATRLDATEVVDAPQYRPKDRTVFAGTLDGDWAELERGLFHEYGHAISDAALDPSSWFIFSYPLFGKYVGGDHDPWKPLGDKKPLLGPNLYGEQVAFEEGLADFIAFVAWMDQRRDVPFDPAMIDDTRAMAELAKHGERHATRMEGVVTRVLLEIYADQLEAGRTAEVLGDVFRTTTYPARGGRDDRPARTLVELLAAKVRRDADPAEAAGGCHVPRPDLGEVAERYGIRGDGVPRARPLPGPDHGLDGAPDFLRNGAGFELERAYRVPAGALGVEISIAGRDFLRDGTLARVDFAAGAAARFTLQPGRIRIDEGRAVVRELDAAVPGATIDHVGTVYAVQVIDGVATVTVAAGRVTITPTGGAAPADVDAGDGARIDADGTVHPLGAPPSAAGDAKASADRGATESTSPRWHLAAIAGGGIAIVLALIVLVRRRRRRGTRG